MWARVYLDTAMFIGYNAWGRCWSSARGEIPVELPERMLGLQDLILSEASRILQSGSVRSERLEGKLVEVRRDYRDETVNRLSTWRDEAIEQSKTCAPHDDSWWESRHRNKGRGVKIPRRGDGIVTDA